MNDLEWDAGPASDFSAWLQSMLVTNPKARSTAEQSAFHPFLEPMDVGAMVEEEMVGISSSSETEREASLVQSESYHFGSKLPAYL